MVNPVAITKSREGKRDALPKVYGLLVVKEPRETTDSAMADLIKANKQDVRNLRLDLEFVGSLESKRIGGGRNGFQTSWTLLDDLETARHKLDMKWTADDQVTLDRQARMGEHNSKLFTGRKRKAEPATNGNGIGVIRQASLTELVHVTGDAPARPMAALGSERYDEPRALVEAARQYAGLHKQVDQKVKELEALGITVDREKLTKAVQLPADPRLAAVAQVIPYVEQLERANDRLSSQVVDYKEKLGNLPELQQRLNRLHDQNARLVAEKVDLQNQLSEARHDARSQRPSPPARTAVGPGREAVPAGK